MVQYCAVAILIAWCAQSSSMEELVARLSADDLAAREKAQTEIQDRWKSWTPADLAALEKATGAGGEVSIRARAAFRRVRFARSLPDEAHAAFPNAVSIVYGGASEKVLELIRGIGVHFEEPGRAVLSSRSAALILLEVLEDERELEEGDANGEKLTLGKVAHDVLGNCVPALRNSDSKERVLAWWGEFKNRPEREWHLPMLDHGDEHVRSEALNRLAALEEPALYPRILEALQDISQVEPLRRAIQGLAPIPGATRAPALKVFLRDRRPDIRLEAAKLVFAELKDESIDAVMETIDQGKPHGTLHWLARCRNERAFAFVLNCLESGSVDVKMAALYALTQADDARVEAALVRAFDDPARLAHWTFGSIQQPRVCDWAGFALTQRLKKDKDYTWPESHRDRDRNLEQLRNEWRKAQGLPAVAFVGPGVKEVEPKAIAALVPDLVHDEPERRRSAIRDLVRLGPGAWTPLRAEIAKSAPAARARLEEAGLACSNALRRVTASSKDAGPFGELLKKRLGEPVDVDRLLKEIVEAWFTDDECCVLRLAVSRGQDGRGVSIDLDLRRRRGTWGSIGGNSMGRCSRVPLDRDAFIQQVEGEFAVLKAAMESADRHAEVSIAYEKLVKSGE